MKLCLGAAVLMLMRTPVLPLALLGDYLHTYFPDIPTSDTYGKVRDLAFAWSPECVQICSLTCSMVITRTSIAS
jgi:hypothetical protein